MKDIAIDLYKYFSKFVPADVLAKSFTQSEATRLSGYSEIATEIQEVSSLRKSNIDTFVVSINESFVSSRIKNAKDFILFVEYGKISYTPDNLRGTTEHIALTIAHPIPENNTDNLNELLIMNECLNIITDIIDTMHAEQNELDFCAGEELISYPADLSVVDPSVFYGCAGWTAMFKNSKTILK